MLLSRSFRISAFDSRFLKKTRAASRTVQRNKHTWTSVNLPAAEGPAVGDGMIRSRSRAFALLDLLDQLGNHLEDIPDDAEIGALKDGRFGVFVDGDDGLGGFHSR